MIHETGLGHQLYPNKGGRPARPETNPQIIKRFEIWSRFWDASLSASTSVKLYVFVAQT